MKFLVEGSARYCSIPNDEYEQFLLLIRCIKPPKLAFSCVSQLRGHAFLGFGWAQNVKIVGQIYFTRAMVHGLPLRTLEDCSVRFPTHYISDVGKRY